MSAPELKPCPFCGGKPYLANKDMPGGAFVVCTDCRAATDDGCIDTAIERWNRRAEAAAPKVKALVEALRWYASQEAWTIDQVEGPHGDYGAKARAALAALEGCDPRPRRAEAPAAPKVSANGEQLRIWAQEILEALALADVLDVKEYHQKVNAHCAVADELRRILAALEGGDG